MIDNGNHVTSDMDTSKHVSSDPAALAAAFACAVTVHADGESLVARNGDLGIFSVYTRIFHQACCPIPSSSLLLFWHSIVLAHAFTFDATIRHATKDRENVSIRARLRESNSTKYWIQCAGFDVPDRGKSLFRCNRPAHE